MDSASDVCAVFDFLDLLRVFADAFGFVAHIELIFEFIRDLCCWVFIIIVFVLQVLLNRNVLITVLSSQRFKCTSEFLWKKVDLAVSELLLYWFESSLDLHEVLFELTYLLGFFLILVHKMLFLLFEDMEIFCEGFSFKPLFL